MTNQNKVYEIITDRIIQELEKGIVPWRKPFTGLKPANLISRKPYRGVNALLLGLMPYEKPFYLTYKQAIESGGNVRKGEHGHMVVFWKMQEYEKENEKGEIEEKMIPFLRYYYVFNIAQCENIPETKIPQLETREFNVIEKGEEIIQGMPNKPDIVHSCNGTAYYSPIKDIVHLPNKDQYLSDGEYYSTAFHEFAHSTGHQTRLNRFTGDNVLSIFGSEIYSKEELIAELASAFLCAEAGINNTISNSAGYIQGWLGKFHDDKKLLVSATSQAQKASDYILGITPE